MLQTFVPTITVENVSPGMVLDFHNSVGEARTDHTTVYLGEAEIISVEAPDGLGDYFGLWVSPEDGSHAEVYVHAYPWQSFTIVG